MNELKSAVERLYATFSPYRVGDDFVGCDCCVSPKESAKLAAGSLRLLTYDDLEHYSRSAMSTWGNVRHFKHFLPRLLELTIEHRDEFLDLAVVFGKLAYAKWYSWPTGEFDATDEFLRAYWEYQLAQDFANPHDDAIDTVLCAEARAHESVQSLLDSWLRTESNIRRKHLAAFVLANDEYLLKKHRLSNSFWDYGSKAHSEVIAWLKSPEVSDYLNRQELSEGFKVAYYQLEAVRAALESVSR